MGQPENMMSVWIEILPEGGWRSFERSEALLDAVWSGLSEDGGKWHCMNLAAGSSIWESCEDGSALSMWYDVADGGRLLELKVSQGVAWAYLLPIALTFGLMVREAD